jgi:hypothetical protein
MHAVVCISIIYLSIICHLSISQSSIIYLSVNHISSLLVCNDVIYLSSFSLRTQNLTFPKKEFRHIVGRHTLDKVAF